MGKIIILDENTVNKIAAGEVIERPASVIKELVENSIDAGATSISVEIRNGGISFIRITDNGCGLQADDVEIAFERHATSKIRRADDLEGVTSMGFRGEALASIAAVSHVQMTTRTRDAVQGTSIELRGGNVVEMKPAGCPAGTTITVRELFYNTPARYKFLKKDAAEAGYVAEVLSRIALGYPDISFKLTGNGSVLLHTPGNGDLKSAIFSIYGAETAKSIIAVDFDDGRVRIVGYVGKAELSRSSRDRQSIYINRRFIKSKVIMSAIDAAYATFLMKNRYAFALLDIRINPALVDVNVHPAKMEVKFSNEQDIYRAVFHAVNGALLGGSGIMAMPGTDMAAKPEFGKETPQGNGATGRKAFSFNGVSAGQSFYLQQRFTKNYAAQDFEPLKRELDKKRHEAISGLPDELKETCPSGEAHRGDTQFNENGATYLPTASGDAESKENRSDLFEGAHVIGQAFSTYILLERGDELLLLDQHAAHERLMYEKLKEAYLKNEPLKQVLLSVLPIELTAAEYQFAMSETAFFESLGFAYESFGTNSVILRSVPYGINETDVREVFLDALDFLKNENSGSKDLKADKALYRFACKSAVKANRRLDEIEIRSLLKDMSALPNPFTCPHGRPAIMKLRRYDLEKLFKRIV